VPRKDAHRDTLPRSRREDATMQDMLMLMLRAMRQAGIAAANDDIKDGMAYDADYAHAQADDVATTYGKAEHVPADLVRDLASEWLSGYQDGYASEPQAD
jgi:hypothetical protein